MLTNAWNKKSGFIAAFFLWLSVVSYASADTRVESESAADIERLKSTAVLRNLAQSPIWSALLHVKDGVRNIEDDKFLLSLPKFSLDGELQRTIDFLYLGEKDHVCRFPARYLWLHKQLGAPELSLELCSELLEFRQKAPVDEVALVFASENIAQPASMLGHAFLKFSGKNEQGEKVSHAISFYTDADTVNLPKLLYDSMIVGKKGYFSLSPFHEKQQLYVDDEQRNLWEYKLKLDAFQKELVRLHVLELKQTHLTYYFQSYNCATLIEFILRLSGKPMINEGWWVTPKDIVKEAYRSGMIEGTSITIPSRWMVRASAEQVALSDQESIRTKLQRGKISDQFTSHNGASEFIKLQFAQAYNQYAYLQGQLDRSIWIDNDHQLKSIKEKSFPDNYISSEDRYNPFYTPGDSQLGFSVFNQHGKAFLALTFLPLSHSLDDDNRAYTSETSLQLFETTMKVSLSDGRPSLERLTIYEMQTLLPNDELTGGVSGRFNIKVEPQLDSRLEVRRAISTSGALGITKRVVRDLDIFALGGGGLSYVGRFGYVYSRLESGVIVREVWDMKSLISLARTDNQIDVGSYYYTFNLSQSKFVSQTSTLNLKVQRDFNSGYRRSTIALTFKRIF